MTFDFEGSTEETGINIVNPIFHPKAARV